MNRIVFLVKTKNKVERRQIMETVQKIALIVTIIGAINWGLIGLLDIDLVASIFGDKTLMSRIIYSIVGICGLINIGILFNHIETK